MTERQRELLQNLKDYARLDRHDEHLRGWARPMDIGGTDGSWRSSVLVRMTRKSWVERRKRDTLGSELGIRGAFRYRLTETGLVALEGG